MPVIAEGNPFQLLEDLGEIFRRIAQSYRYFVIFEIWLFLHKLLGSADPIAVEILDIRFADILAEKTAEIAGGDQKVLGEDLEAQILGVVLPDIGQGLLHQVGAGPLLDQRVVDDLADPVQIGVEALAEGKRSRSAVAERDIGGEAAMCPPDRCPNFIATSKRPGSYLRCKIQAF